MQCEGGREREVEGGWCCGDLLVVVGSRTRGDGIVQRIGVSVATQSHYSF